MQKCKDTKEPPAADRISKPLLEVRAVSKHFPGVLALDGVSMKLYGGRILAVIGENGAGKSTLMKILAGVLQPDGGGIILDGQEVVIDSVSAAMKLGITLIHQELNLSENLDVASNVFLGREPVRYGCFKLIDKGQTIKATRDILQRLGVDLCAHAIVKTLAIGQRQLVEIARALSVNARILILDEPTSSLSEREKKRLFDVLSDLKRQGVSIIYISHRLSEVKQVADQVMVLRDGRNSGELARDEIEHDRMVKLMVGRDIDQFYAHKPHRRGQWVLDVEDLELARKPGVLLNFKVGAGEIVGLAGLVGAGRTELAQALFGIERPISGRISLGGKPLPGGTSREAIRAGLALVPEDRKEQGLVLPFAVKDNIALAGLDHYQVFKFIRRGRIRTVALKMVNRLSIRTPGVDQPVQHLSGGNQQKVVLAKWLSQRLSVLIMDEPTRGVDVGAKQDIYRLMEELTREGLGILMISSEMEEVLSMSDRVLVMHEGRLTGELPAEQMSEEAIMQRATGTL